MEPVSTSKKDSAKSNGKPELDQDLSKEQHGKGKRGSLENPEVYENVPGHIIPILEREFDDFETEAASFLRGEQTEEQFIGFRLKQGVYGQRQLDVKMIRGINRPVGLNEAAVQIIRKSTFVPGMKDGVRVKSWATVPVNFKL